MATPCSPRRDRSRGTPAARRGSRAAPPPCPPARSARSRARSRGRRCRSALRAFCSTRRTVVPSSAIRSTMAKMSFTTSGASPIDGSSSIRSFGRAMSARPMASICCSPPERVPASWPLALLEDGEEPVDALEVRRHLVAAARARTARARRGAGSRAPASAAKTCRPSGTSEQPEGDDPLGGEPRRRPRRRRRSRRRGPDEAGDRPEQRGLPRAVRADDGDDLARRSRGARRAAAPRACRSRRRGCGASARVVPQVDPDRPRGRAAPRAGSRRRSSRRSESTTTSSEMFMTSPMSCSTRRTVTPRSRIRADELRELRRLAHVEAGGRLVEEEELRLGGERARQLDRALLAVGEARRPRGRRARATPRNVERVAGARARSRAPRARSRAGGASRRRTRPGSARGAPTITFSSAVICANSRICWKVRETPSAAIAVRRAALDRPRRGGGPSRRRARSTPETRLKSVVLPAPFGPMTAFTVPFSTRKETSFTACRPPKRFESAAHLEERGHAPLPRAAAARPAQPRRARRAGRAAGRPPARRA